MDLHMKAGEHFRITHDKPRKSTEQNQPVGFLVYYEGDILHVTAKAPDDPVPTTEIVSPAPRTPTKPPRRAR